MSAPIRVRCEYFSNGMADWLAVCGLCDEYLYAGDHESCLTWALGHLSFRHG